MQDFTSIGWNLGAMSLDRRAVDILKKTYWTPAGWRRESNVAPDDFAYAKSQGVMFDSIHLSHDQAIELALRAAGEISQDEVVDAFVASLGSRRLDLRSGLGSYAVARHLRQHRMVTSPASKRCAYCGLYDKEDVDLNILSFERIKWGGVRHDQPTYIALDLRMLRDTSHAPSEPSDFAVLRSIIETARSMPHQARLGDLDKALAKALPSNSAERRILIGLLGYAGILIDATRPDFRRAFVPSVERERTLWHKDDWPYPVQWWNGSHGVDEAAIVDWFPMIKPR